LWNESFFSAPQLKRDPLDGGAGKHSIQAMKLQIEVEREDDGRWMAEVPDLAGVLTYGRTRDEALAKVQALALRVIAERLEHGEGAPSLLQLTFQAA
jgi:predicted RNase H-like HicB family nuclease